MTELNDPERWEWCWKCECPTIVCPKCRRSICSGGDGPGSPCTAECDAEMELAHVIMCDQNLWPPLDQIKGYSTREADEAKWKDEYTPGWREEELLTHQADAESTNEP